MSTTVGVLVLDEPQGFGAPLCSTLERMPEFRAIGEADLDGADPESTVALVFLDEIRLADGIARIVSLKERRPHLRTLVAFSALTADDLRALLEAGADAFVVRSNSPQELGAALLALVQGSDCLVPPNQPTAVPADNTGLTPREVEVLRFLSCGFSNKEVARQLDLSVRTVESHRLNLRRKTQSGRLKELVSLAHQLGLPPVVDGGKQVRRSTEIRSWH